MNTVALVGRLTKDPELRYTQSGVAVTSFTIAVNRPFKNAQGENEADFILCQAWRAQAENLANYQQKGNQIGVSGRIQTRNYENNEGQRVYITEVVADNIQFLEPKKDGKPKMNGKEQAEALYSDDPFKDSKQIPDQDLPF